MNWKLVKLFQNPTGISRAEEYINVILDKNEPVKVGQTKDSTGAEEIRNWKSYRKKRRRN